MLTPKVVAAAALEIKTGERVSLDWSLTKPSHPSFGRAPFKHTMTTRKDAQGNDRTANDDSLEFNTQCSSQWDGFRHYGYSRAKRFYNNRTQHDLETSPVIGTGAVASVGGIVSRGVLLDYAAYAVKHNTKLDHFSSSGIPLSELKAAAAEQGLSFRAGDVLVLRVGFTAAYDVLSLEEQAALPDRPSPDFLGVQPTREMLEWIWDSGFAAVASDAVAFEQAPVFGPHVKAGEGGLWEGESWEEEMQGGGLLHQWLLGGWGMLIGEMFDLEALAEKCRELGRSTFFLSSLPLNVPGGVASPPNAVAIF